MYDNLINECVHWQEGRIDRFIKRCQEYVEANTKGWMIAAKDLLVNTVRGVILPMLMDLIFRAKQQKQSDEGEVKLKKELSTVSETAEETQLNET